MYPSFNFTITNAINISVLPLSSLQPQIILNSRMHIISLTNIYCVLLKSIFNIIKIKHLEERGKVTWAQEFETNLGT